MKLLKRATIPKLSKKVVAKVVRKLGIETIQEESWRGYWDVTLIS
jgi:signal recognition particle subunit SEC65